MSLTGKNTLSLRRKDVQEQKSIAIGFKKIQFAHKATLGDTGINLNSLILPSEMSGFTNPSPAELLEAQLFFYRKNLTLISSTKGLLIDYMSYNVSSSSQITFVNFTADDGEVFTGIIDAVARTGIQLVDAAPLVSTGELAIAAFDFNVGQLFEINKYSSSQVGGVIVYRNGAQQFRNTSNSAVTLDGNYYEVNNGSGTGQVIRFNSAPSGSSDSILVVSNGLMAYNPDGSALQRIESISGKIDSMVPTLAALAGVPQSTFGGVTNVDLKSFGDVVLSNTNRLTALEVQPRTAFKSYGNVGQSILDNVSTNYIPTTLPLNVGTGLNISTGIFTAPRKGDYFFNAGSYYTAAVNFNQIELISNNGDPATLGTTFSLQSCYVSGIFHLEAGQTVVAKFYHNSGGTRILSTDNRLNYFHGFEIGNR